MTPDSRRSNLHRLSSPVLPEHPLGEDQQRWPRWMLKRKCICQKPATAPVCGSCPHRALLEAPDVGGQMALEVDA